MYNNNEYAQPGYESNYEFNPQQEEELEMENYEYGFNNEYELNPELEMEWIKHTKMTLSGQIKKVPFAS